MDRTSNTELSLLAVSFHSHLPILLPRAGRVSRSKAGKDYSAVGFQEYGVGCEMVYQGEGVAWGVWGCCSDQYSSLPLFPCDLYRAN